MPGGILCAYTPSILQATQCARRLASEAWVEGRTLEVLQRTWHVEGQAVRPDHRMVAHTGFLTTARFLVPLGRLSLGDGRRAALPVEGARGV